MHLKYTNKQSLGRKGVGTAFPRVLAEKNTGSLGRTLKEKALYIVQKNVSTKHIYDRLLALK